MPPNRNLLNGLLAFWKLDETSGTRADYTGTYNLSESGGTVTGGNVQPQFNPSFYNGTVSTFNGSTSLEWPTASDLAIVGGFTMCAWVKQTSLPAFNAVICGKYFVETNGLAYVIQYGAPTQGLTLSAGYGSASDGSQLVSTAVPNSGDAFWQVGKWYFVAGRIRQVNGGITVEISIDNGPWYTNERPSATVIPGVSRFSLGARSSSTGTTNNRLTGSLCNVGLWGRPLRNYEIGTLWNGGYGLDAPFTI